MERIAERELREAKQEQYDIRVISKYVLGLYTIENEKYERERRMYE